MFISTHSKNNRFKVVSVWSRWHTQRPCLSQTLRVQQVAVVFIKCHWHGICLFTIIERLTDLKGFQHGSRVIMFTLITMYHAGTICLWKIVYKHALCQFLMDINRHDRVWRVHWGCPSASWSRWYRFKSICGGKCKIFTLLLSKIQYILTF